MNQIPSFDRRAARPTTAADLWRLADQGRTNGVTILTEVVSGARFASSATRPGTIYYLTAYSCTCPGFVAHQRCQHHSLLLAELGWLPDPDDDGTRRDPLAAAPALVPTPVVAITDDRRDELAERRARAEEARQRLAVRAADPGAADRALAVTNAARARRMASGLSVVRG